MADRKIAYAASADLTVTNLHSLAASSTWMTGWESGVIDNTTNKYLDYIITGKLVSHASNRQAGTMYVYAFAMLDDTNYFDALDGTESNAEAMTAAVMRDGAGKLAAALTFTNGASEIGAFTFNIANLFGGNCPAKFSLWITGNIATTTAAQLASSGSQITIKGIYETIA